MADRSPATEPCRPRWFGWLGPSATARLGSALIACGLLVLVYAGLWQVGLAPGSRVSVEEPVAIARMGGVRQVGAQDTAAVSPPAARELEPSHAAPPVRDTEERARP